MSAHGATAHPTPRPARGRAADEPPAAVQAARATLGVVAATHVAVPLVLLLDDGARSPEHTVARAVGLHLPLLVLVLVLVRALPTGSRWARRPTTVAMTLSTIFGLVLWNAPITVPAATVIAVIAQVLVLALLWGTTTARRFFATAPTRRSADGRWVHREAVGCWGKASASQVRLSPA